MITIYTKPNCPYCVMAKKHLLDNAIEFAEVDVANDPAALVFLREQGHRTVPQLYQNGSLLVEGGCDGLRKLNRDQIIERVNSLSS